MSPRNTVVTPAKPRRQLSRRRCSICVGAEKPLIEPSSLARFQVAPDDFDVVQLGGVFGRPFDGEPMGALGERRPAGLAEVDGAIVEDKDDWLGRRAPGLGP
jgi:hypothetical protein